MSARHDRTNSDSDHRDRQPHHASAPGTRKSWRADPDTQLRRSFSQPTPDVRRPAVRTGSNPPAGRADRSQGEALTASPYFAPYIPDLKWMAHETPTQYLRYHRHSGETAAHGGVPHGLQSVAAGQGIRGRAAANRAVFLERY